MSSELYKKYIPVIIVVGLMVLLNVFAVIWYVVPGGPDRWNEETVPGKVVSVTEASLTTRDPRGNTKTFIITSETQILAGKKNAEGTLLQPGTMVLVELDLGTSTDLVAQEIRVLTDKRKEKEKP
jgi:Domain of unknown function (DUF5666)